MLCTDLLLMCVMHWFIVGFVVYADWSSVISGFVVRCVLCGDWLSGMHWYVGILSGMGCVMVLLSGLCFASNGLQVCAEWLPDVRGDVLMSFRCVLHAEWLTGVCMVCLTGVSGVLICCIWLDKHSPVPQYG